MLGAIPAVALFAEWAGAVMPGFTITDENALTVAWICRRLDGLPLAIELAAPWVRLLTPQGILDQLDSRLELLVDGPRDLPARQRAMRTTLAWSHDLLDGEAQALLRRLSVFQGGAPLEALDSVCRVSPALASLAMLVDHGLALRAEDAGGTPRVNLLETVRSYGRELLAAAGEQDDTAAAHLEFYMGLASQFRRAGRTAALAAWLKRMRDEQESAGDRADGDAQAAHRGPDADCLRPFARNGENGADHREGRRHDEGGAHSHDGAGGDELGRRVRERGAQRAQAEDRQARAERVVTPVAIGERAREQEQRGEGEGVRVDDPLQARGARVQVSRQGRHISAGKFSGVAIRV